MSDLLVFVAEQGDEDVHGAEVVQAPHVLDADGALPDGARGGGQQRFVELHVLILDDGHQWVQAAVLPHHVSCRAVLCALQGFYL